MLTELKAIAKQLFLPHLTHKINSLNLETKNVAGISFDAVQAGWYLRNGYPQIYSILTGGMPAWSGEAVSIETALNHSVVWACNKIISESIGFLPAVLYQKKNGSKREATEHPMHVAMRYAPNAELTAQTFTEMLTSHCLMQGNGYAHIIRRSGSGTAIAFKHLLPQNVFPDREKGGRKRLVYVIKNPGDAEKTYTVDEGKPQDILHLRGIGWDGLRGYSVITMGRQSIGTAIALDRNTARFWAYGGRRPYHLELDKKFKTDQDFEKFRDDWERVYAEPQRAPMTEPGIKMIEHTGTLQDSQFLETKLATVTEICRWFNVSPHLVQDLSRATFSNIEHLALDFVKFTLNPWLWRWEQEFSRCVLTAEERAAGYYLRHDVRELLRGDFQTRMAGYSIALQNGFMNRDEVRDDLEMDPIQGEAGKYFTVQLNMQELSNLPNAQEQQLKPMMPEESPKGRIRDWIRRIA